MLHVFASLKGLIFHIISNARSKRLNDKKTVRISKITNEVDDFHPLLKELFSRLPNIQGIEYTHGQNEMGADFVLEKVDETLSRTVYIGCIVKVGKIRQDFQDIDRQIEECEVERHFNGGKKKIFINEIWVVASDTISEGAKDKIHHKYKNKNISFISGEDVAAFLDDHFPEYWVDVSLKMGRYLDGIRHRSNSIAKSYLASGAAGNKVYIPQQLERIITRKKLGGSSSKPPKRLTLEQSLVDNDFLLIEGVMGSGKSTLLAEIARSYSEVDHYNSTKAFPILISATELSGKYEENVNKLFEEASESAGLESTPPLVLFLIDGFDELRIDEERRKEFFEKVFSSASRIENAKVVISTRSIDSPALEADIDRRFVRFNLCMLTVRQILILVESICKNEAVSQKLSKDLDKSHLFKMLPKTPISAILLAKLLNESVQEIPSTMTELYSKYMELSLGRWDMDKGLQSQQEYDVVRNVTIELAKFVMDNSLIEIPLGDVRTFFSDYVGSRKLGVNKEDTFQKLINKNDIFLLDKFRNVLSFRHRTFAEYFFAEGMRRDSTAVIDENIYNFYWSTSYFFLIGIQRDCPDILKALDEIKFSDEMYRFFRIFCNGNFLLAAYLTPYDVVTRTLESTYLDAAKLLQEVNDQADTHPLAAIPPLQLLCMVTQGLCSTFGYEYFNEALKEIAMEIYTRSNLTSIDYTQLFLLNSARITLEHKESFDLMLEKHHENLPLSILAGILEHSIEHDVLTRTLKRYRKKFDSNMRTDSRFRKTVLALYDEPLTASKRTLPATIAKEKISKDDKK